MFRLLFTFSLFSLGAHAEVIQTNAAYIHNAPDWLKRTKVERAIDRVQTKLEWTTRRISIYYHTSELAFSGAHDLGPQAIAVAIKSPRRQVVHLSPRVTAENYQQVIGHEMVHIIIYQKYKGAIPRWLEEGMANHLSNRGKIDYKKLSKRPLPDDVTALGHPFKPSSISISTHYKTSQALAEMLDKKCKLERLLQLSVQRKMQDYIKTYCEIKDINKAFRDWVSQKAKNPI